MARAVSFHLITLACFVTFPYTHSFGVIATNGCYHTMPWTQTSLLFSTATAKRRLTQTRLCAKDENPKDDFKFDPNMPVIMRGSQEDEISTEVWENVDTGQPPDSVIMKEVSLISGLVHHVFPFQTHVSFSIVASWNQHFYLPISCNHCFVSDAEFCLWSWVAWSSTWNEGNWHLYRCVHFVARHCRSQQSRLSFIRNRDNLIDNAMIPRMGNENEAPSVRVCRF
jgi:hypothetical protein